MTLQNTISTQLNQEMVGKTLPVLVEEYDEELGRYADAATGTRPRSTEGCTLPVDRRTRRAALST